MHNWLFIPFALAISGCAGAPVGWGGTDEVLFANADTIKIQWDNLTTNEEAARIKAIAHCGGRGVALVDANSDTGTLGLIRSRTWRCTGSLPAPAARLQPQPIYYTRQADNPASSAPRAGQDALQAERFARDQQCHTAPHATLAAKGPGFETFSVPCSSGETIIVRCEFGNCRAMK